MLLNTIFKLVPSFYCAILVQFSHIKQKLLENYLKNKKTVLESYMQIFVLFLMIPVVFVIVEYEISHFFPVKKFNSR